MVNFVICDDEINMLNKMCYLFEKSFFKNNYDAEIVLKTTDYKTLLSYINTNKVDVVILDIEFKNSNNNNGIEIAKEIRKINKNCYLIFATSHFEYILQAYQLKTFDYLIKNAISLDTVSNTLSRLFDDISNANSLFFRIDNKGSFIDLNDVQFIEKIGMKLIYHTSQNTFETYNSFSKIENKLPNNFVRCHKSYIANINNIIHISFSDNTILFRNSSSCYIGPKYKNILMEMIKNYENIFK